LIDSGCSRHITGDKKWFSSLTPLKEKMYITFGDNERGRVISEGVVHVSDKVTLKRVALVKSLGINLLSVSQLLDEGFEVCFKSGDLVCWILKVILFVLSSPRVRFSGLISLVLWVLLVV
jgi:hypothetical protein